MKNILIIGGSYFAGRIFVEEMLKTKDYNLYVFNRGHLPFNRKDVIELKGDREKIDDIKGKIPDLNWDALVDFCAYTPDHISKMISSLPGTLKHYIFISTTTIYENVLGLPVAEDAPKVMKVQPELGQYAEYGYNKWRAELRLKEECVKKGIEFTSLRPSIVYGEYNYAPRESWFFDQIRDEKPLVLPDPGLALFSFVYVLDLARILIKTILNENMFNLGLNVASEELVSYPRLYEVFKNVTNKDFETIDMDIETINSKRIPIPFPPDIHLVYSGKKLQDILGVKFTPLMDGMKRTYAYYQMVQDAKNKKK